ncbi:MAG: hypothetical protein P4L33_06720 [Capsulimonadaceae bacterium]|nr:hypothetical protein [Capsulimonadaceae bacterium]
MNRQEDKRSWPVVAAALALVAALSLTAATVHQRGISSRAVRHVPVARQTTVVHATAHRTQCLTPPVRVHIAYGPHAMFAPFTRAQVVAVMIRWKTTPPVEVRSTGLAFSSRYEQWKQRARAYANALQARGEIDEAIASRRWIASYENHQRAAGFSALAPIPDDLALAAGGNPPRVFRGVCNEYTVYLPGIVRPFVYQDHPVDPDYPYLVNDTGVADEGTPLARRPDAPHLMRAAGLTHEQRVVLLKVSEREGGFEAVNTYDTGYVSIGFIQFAAMQSGTGSLAKLLEKMKTTSPGEFRHYFQNFGIDVDDQHCLCAIDPATGKVLHGSDAVAAIIGDKRLTAVFGHAGAGSVGFQKAQLAQAVELYYAPAHEFSLPVAKVVDHSDPWHPVETYCYGNDAIAFARTTVVAQNALPWRPPAPPVISVPPHRSVRPVRMAPVSVSSTSGALPRLSPEGSLGDGLAAPPMSGDTAEQMSAAGGRVAPKTLPAYRGPHYSLVILPNITGRYRQVFQSEAGRTAITDRCIQRGYDVGPTKQGLAAKFAEAVGAVANGDKLTVGDLAARERDLDTVVQNRIMVLGDSSLGQPGEASRVASRTHSRAALRRGKTGGA